jgi:hypothetical protein
VEKCFYIFVKIKISTVKFLYFGKSPAKNFLAKFLAKKFWHVVLRRPHPEMFLACMLRKEGLVFQTLLILGWKAEFSI